MNVASPVKYHHGNFALTAVCCSNGGRWGNGIQGEERSFQPCAVNEEKNKD